MSIELEPIFFASYTSNTPAQLAGFIGLAFADFDDGADRFQAAIDSARNAILFRLGKFDENSYPEDAPFDTVKLTTAQGLAGTAEWNLAGSTLYTHKGQLEVQFGDSGTPSASPDFQIGAFTPEKDVLSHAYRKRATELQAVYESIMNVIIPNTNMAIVASASGRSDFTDNGEFWGSDDPWT